MLYNISKSLYICVTMKAKTYISRTFSLSCLLAGALAFFALNALANSSSFLPTDNNKDKTKKTADSQHFVLNTAMPKTNLSLDAAYRYSGTFSSDFKFTTNTNNVNNANNVINLKAVMTYTKGNVTYVVPSNVQVQSQPPGNMNFQKLQIILPLKKG
jgi:esterase/lipase superfamily enzyme